MEIITQKEFPGWGWQVTHGATSLWECWNGIGSRNHIMFGDFAAWAYQYLAGIRLPDGGSSAVQDPGEVGFRRFLLAPDPIAALDFVEAKTQTPYGTIESSWKREGGSVVYDFTVPPGTAARLRLKGAAEETLLPGRHRRVQGISASGVPCCRGKCPDAEAADGGKAAF